MLHPLFAYCRLNKEFRVTELVQGVALTAIASLSLGAACHALLMKRDPRSALGWIITTLALPIAGPVLYWLLGINRISRRARQWQESGRRLPSSTWFRACQRLESAAPLPREMAHLQELRTLSDHVVTPPCTSGNRLLPLHNGENAYPAMLAAMATASHSIHLSTYIFDTDTTGRRFIHTLATAAARGVEVRLLIDGLGEKYSWPSARRLLQGSGVTVARFLPLHQGGYLNLRNHRKILIVDGTTAFTGGMNLGGRHMVAPAETPFPVADLHFQVSGPVVADLQKVFLEDWFFATGHLLDDPCYFPIVPPTGSALVKCVADGPDKDFRKLLWIMLGALACATSRVHIMTPYFIPDRSLISALATAAMRGIQVTIILPEQNNLPFIHWATRSYLWELLQSGVRICYQPPPFAHTKLFLVDGLWSLVGSANLDPRSLRLNFELNLEVYDRDLTTTLEVHFMETRRRSREVTIEEMDRRPFHEKIRDGAAKLLSPYL